MADRTASPANHRPNSQTKCVSQNEFQGPVVPRQLLLAKHCWYLPASGELGKASLGLSDSCLEDLHLQRKPYRWPLLLPLYKHTGVFSRSFSEVGCCSAQVGVQLCPVKPDVRTDEKC